MVNELRIIDMKQNTLEANDGVFELDVFMDRQEERRQEVSRVIETNSQAVKESFAEGIEQVLKELRQKESEQTEQPTAKQEVLKGSDFHKPKQIVNTNQTLEELGFKHDMNYGPKSNLRKNCMRFLRFSYLLDFLTTEALTNIYIHSVRETIQKLEKLATV